MDEKEPNKWALQECTPIVPRDFSLSALNRSAPATVQKHSNLLRVQTQGARVFPSKSWTAKGVKDKRKGSINRMGKEVLKKEEDRRVKVSIVPSWSVLLFT